MAAFRFTVRAHGDLLSIAQYTKVKWGDDQARQYLAQLQRQCAALPGDASFDRVFPPIPRYLRANVAKHVVFFLRKDTGEVVVIRILHGRMLPERHLNVTGEPDE